MKPTLIALPSAPLGRKFVDTFSYPWQSIQADNSVGKPQKIFVQYNGHRLPLQPASRDGLLDDLYPIGENLETFFHPWNGRSEAGQNVAAGSGDRPHTGSPQVRSGDRFVHKNSTLALDNTDCLIR